MLSKSKKIFTDEKAQKIGRRLEPEASWDTVKEHPLGAAPSLSGDSQDLKIGSERDSSLPLHRKDGRNSIGQAIRFIRKERGITQEVLAKMARVDRTTVARIECGIFKSISVEKLEGIAVAIGLDLKTLFVKAGSLGESLSYRGHLGQIEFALDYPQEGFRIISHFPKQREFFFGRVVIEPQKTILSKKLPHPQQIYLHALEGKLLLTMSQKEILLKPGDCFAFPGLVEYELYNPDQFKPVSSLFITYPSFLTV